MMFFGARHDLGSKSKGRLGGMRNFWQIMRGSRYFDDLTPTRTYVKLGILSRLQHDDWPETLSQGFWVKPQFALVCFSARCVASFTWRIGEGSDKRPQS